MQWKVPAFAKGHPPYVYVYWFAVLGAGAYYGVEYLLTPKAVTASPEPKKIELNTLSDEQLERLKQQRLDRLRNKKE